MSSGRDAAGSARPPRAARPRNPGVPRGDKDQAQKAALRRAFRAHGWGTRTNVLLADVSEGRRELTPQSYTDVDVLGIGYAPDLRPVHSVGYCTTSKATSERVFWLRGVRDEFPGATGILVAQAIPASARALCVRNGLIALTEPELADYVAAAERDTSPARREFEERLEPGVMEYARAIRTLPKPFDAVVAFRDYIHQQLGPARTLQVAVSTLRLPADAWRPYEARHLALLLDMTAIYVSALIEAARYVHGVGRQHVEEALAVFAGGGPAALRDKRNLTKLVAQLLDELATQGVQLPPKLRDAIRPLPEYVGDLASIVSALLARPTIAARLPWYLETLQLAAVQGKHDVVGVLTDIGEAERVVEESFRLVREVLGFLVNHSHLSRDHLGAFDRLLAPAPALRVVQPSLDLGIPVS